MKIKEVFKRVYNPGRLYRAWQRVRKNAGAAGIDDMTVKDFEKREKELLDLTHEKLKSGKYRFKPARRVLIPKPGTPKQRKLQIPVVMDRIVSQSLHSVLEEIFDADFTNSNFGYRRGRSQHQAIKHAQEAALDGHKWCVSIDIHGFFDEISHDLILRLIRRKIYDEQLVTQVARALKAGVKVDGVFQKTTKGCPQGSPVSPILSNIVLNELDYELERRGHRYSRWADDFIILLKTKRSAMRVMESMTEFIENKLGLKINQEKSQVAPVREVEFLGFQILGGKLKISPKELKRFKEKIRILTPRNNGSSMHHVIQDLNNYLRGWINYFRIQGFTSILKKLDRYIRNRLRSMQLKKWKKPKKFQRIMIREGYPVHQARTIWVKMAKWQSVHRRIVKFIMNLKWFRRQRLLFLDDFTERNLELPFTR